MCLRVQSQKEAESSFPDPAQVVHNAINQQPRRSAHTNCLPVSIYRLALLNTRTKYPDSQHFLPVKPANTGCTHCDYTI